MFILFTRWLPLIAYCIVIFLQSSGPAPQSLPQLPHLDKLLHAAAYALLAVLFYRAYHTIGLRRLPMAWLSVVSAVLYGAFDELHQSFVPTRSADGFDLLADVLGAAVGTLVYLRYCGRLENLRSDIRVDKKNRIG